MASLSVSGDIDTSMVVIRRGNAWRDDEHSGTTLGSTALCAIVSAKLSG